MLRFLIFTLIYISTLLIGSLTVAQTCSAELRGDLSDEALQEFATGTDAVVFMQRAMQLLEPALPKLAYLPNDFAYLDNNAAVYVGTRGLLPVNWEPDTLTLGVWQELIQGLGAWYDLEPELSDDLTRAGLLTTLENLVTRAAATLRPVALVASSQDDENKVAFWAIIRNDSIYPRIIVYRPSTDPVGFDSVGLQDGVANALPLLGNCAMPLQNYIYASEDTARRLFLSNNTATMYVAATKPETSADPNVVPEGEEIDYLTFHAAALEGYSAFAALFEGSGVGPMTVIRLLPQVRTNMNPAQVIRFVLGIR
jgi:hypothetical protein